MAFGVNGVPPRTAKFPNVRCLSTAVYSVVVVVVPMLSGFIVHISYIITIQLKKYNKNFYTISRNTEMLDFFHFFVVYFMLSQSKEIR